MSDQPAAPVSPSQEVTRASDPSSSASANTAFGVISEIGPYRLVKRVGEGGMGEVWLAEQTAPIRRDVALKLIKAGMDTEHVVARFEAERQALAVMDHPAIAKVFDAGATALGRPYFAMEYVRGEAINAYCSREQLSVVDRLLLFLQVCDGVQHAHQKAIIHRDLKPSNVLVTLVDGHPVPKIIDFGIAKAIGQSLTEHTLYTEVGVLIGTPEYMSPEQAGTNGADIDTRADVYALGVILYELLTGLLPFDALELRQKSLDEVIRIVREVEPSRPSDAVTEGPEAKSLAKKLRGDLDWITMRALDKDRNRRYGSATELAEDIRRHLNQVPVIAGPPNAAYRLRKFVRRHRGGVIIATGFGVLLLTFATTEAVQARRIAIERDRANQQSSIASAVNDFLQNDLLAQASATAQATVETTPDPDLKVRSALDRAASRIGSRFKNEPLVEASIRQTIGTTYRDLGLLPDAKEQLQRSWELRRAALGDGASETLESAVLTADTLRRQGNFLQADSVLSGVLTRTRDQTPAPPDTESANILSTLGEVKFERGDYKQAEALFKEALPLRERKLGADHLATLETLNDLALTLERLDKVELAVPMLQRVLEGHRKQLGSHHPGVAQSANNLAMAYYRLKGYGQAEPLFREALAINRESFGNEHPEVATTLSNIASLRRDLGDYKDAELLLREAIRTNEHLLGLGHPRVATSVVFLADVKKAEGDYIAAESLFRRALQIRQRAFGDNSWQAAETQSMLGEILARRGERNEARRLLTDAIPVLQAQFGADNSRTRAAVQRLAAFSGH